METTICADKYSVGEVFRIFRDDFPLCSLRAWLSGRVGPQFPVCSVHFSDSGIDAGRGLESVTPRFVEYGSVVHQHGSWIGGRRGVHHPVAASSLVAR